MTSWLLWLASGCAGLLVDYALSPFGWRDEGESPLILIFAVCLSVALGPVGLALTIGMHCKERTRTR